jgi:multicomponent Na+:H+ antiporter subunit D
MAMLVALATAVPVAWLGVRVLDSGALRYDVGGWGEPLGIALVVDGPAAVFLGLTAFVCCAVTFYASGYLAPATEQDEGLGHGQFWTLWLFMWASLNALFMTGDIFNVYVCLELVGLAAVALVSLAEEPKALRAGIRYLFASILGAMTYLLGVALVYSATGVLDMGLLMSTLQPSVAAQTGIALMVAALLLKTALVPVHFWLPAAHSAAPSPVSAALSALVIKGSFFVLLRLLLDVMPTGFLGDADVLLGILGAAAIIWGSVQALAQRRLKLLIAYSTVAQIGYLFIIFPLAHAGGAVLSSALLGTLVQAVSHGLAKASMFLAAGMVLRRFGHDRIGDLAGAARRTPALAATFALAGVTMTGLPPSGGFAAKWLLVSASIEAGDWWWAVVVVAGGLLAAAYTFRLLEIFMADPGDRPEPSAAPHPVRTEWLPLGLAVASFLVLPAVPILTRLVDAGSLLLRAGGVAP